MDKEKSPHEKAWEAAAPKSIEYGDASARGYQHSNLEYVQDNINALPNSERGKLSDGYHTFDELYEFRKLYNAKLFNEWGKEKAVDGYKDYRVEYDVHKSWRHYDGNLCFNGNYFIVVAMLPTGQISNHYPAEDWELFKVPAVEKAKYEFDGHTPADVLKRLKALK